MWTSFIGFMASGKSSVTRRLQAATSRPALSLDQQIEEQAGMSVTRVFAQLGEATFREMELAAISAMDPDRPLLVDTGGGVVQVPKAVEVLRQRGVVIWLDAPWETLRARLKDSDQELRPLIARLGWVELEELFRRRRRLYAAAADFRLRADQGDVDDIAHRAMLRSLQWERRREEARR
jgi:shikimate kinase